MALSVPRPLHPPYLLFSSHFNVFSLFGSHYDMHGFGSQKEMWEGKLRAQSNLISIFRIIWENHPHRWAARTPKLVEAYFAVVALFEHSQRDYWAVTKSRICAKCFGHSFSQVFLIHNSLNLFPPFTVCVLIFAFMLNFSVFFEFELVPCFAFAHNTFSMQLYPTQLRQSQNVIQNKFNLI